MKGIIWYSSLGGSREGQNKQMKKKIKQRKKKKQCTCDIDVCNDPWKVTIRWSEWSHGKT